MNESARLRLLAERTKMFCFFFEWKFNISKRFTAPSAIARKRLKAECVYDIKHFYPNNSGEVHALASSYLE